MKVEYRSSGRDQVNAFYLISGAFILSAFKIS